MKKRFKSFYFLISSLFIALLHLPFVFAKTASGTRLIVSPIGAETIKLAGVTYLPSVDLIYDSLRLQLAGLSREAFEYARKGFDKLLAQGKVINNSIISIVDFSQPSNRKRLYVIDMENYRMLFNTWVSHGRNSGREMANSFSNTGASYKSSPGFYVTREPYFGDHGYSLRLQGLEEGINDNAYKRAIVLHGANYVSPSVIAAKGYIGRSLGCPAVPVKLATPIINTIKNGTCLFIYHPGSFYLKRSNMLS